MTPHDVSSFWLHAGEQRWFTKDAAFDGELKVRFGTLWERARLGHLDQWGSTPEGALGLVILLDQVPRNIHRGSPLAFATDGRALQLVKDWVGRSYHWKLPAPHATWILMPFEHSENIDDQWRCISLFQSLGLSDKVYWAKVHLDIIAKFGRFPHRNAVLGRRSTPEELAFLKSGGFAG